VGSGQSIGRYPSQLRSERLTLIRCRLFCANVVVVDTVSDARRLFFPRLLLLTRRRYVWLLDLFSSIISYRCCIACAVSSGLLTGGATQFLASSLVLTVSPRVTAAANIGTLARTCGFSLNATANVSYWIQSSVGELPQPSDPPTQQRIRICISCSSKCAADPPATVVAAAHRP
jgi:hypothetical protein